MKKICGIYKIENPNGRVYIGQSLNILYRKYSYSNLDCADQPYVFKSLKKYGFENHKFEIIEECPRELLNEREVYWIQFYNSFKDPERGMNLQSGGQSNFEVSNETKKKLSDRNTGEGNPFYGKTHTKETLEKIKNTKIKNGTEKPEYDREKWLKINSHFIGVKQSLETVQKRIETKKKNGTGKHTEESKKKMSESHKNKAPTLEHRKNISKANTGKVRSNETKQKISEANLNRDPEIYKKMGENQRGENSPHFGKKHSEERKREISEKSKEYWKKRKESEQNQKEGDNET